MEGKGPRAAGPPSSTRVMHIVTIEELNKMNDKAGVLPEICKALPFSRKVLIQSEVSWKEKYR